MSDAPYGYHPGTRIPRKAPWREEYSGQGACKHCGEKFLVWERQESGWVLTELGGRRHVCRPGVR